jgi:hypothetical protein
MTHPDIFKAKQQDYHLRKGAATQDAGQHDASQVTPEAALARILQKSEAFFEIAKDE